MTDPKLLETVEKTVGWASELGDQWVGTLIGRMLDAERDYVLEAVKRGDPELASAMVLNLTKTCQHAEKQLKEVEELSV